MAVYGNKVIKETKENIGNEYLEEGAIATFLGTILFYLLAPYIIMFAIIILLYPLFFIAGKINESRINKFLAKNPEFLKAADDFGKSVYESLCKIYPDNKKYLKYDFDKKIEIKKTKSKDGEEYIVSADIISINGNNILYDATGYKDAGKYLDSIGWEDPDAEPRIKEFNEITNKIKKSIDDLNKQMKESFKNSNIIVEYNDDYINEYPLSSYGCFEVDGISVDVNISISIKVKDFNNVKLPEPIKKKVNVQVEKLRPKFKDLK